jgi:DNA-binding HxlR family transcriptional regulator
VDRPLPPRAGERRAARRPLPSHRQWTPLGRALSVVGDNWTLAIVVELSAGRMRLSALRERLSGVSAGVLDRYLHRMSEAGLVTRVRFREMPPRVELELTDAGRELVPIVAALSQWGARWSWSDVREGEIVDPGALLRALPMLVEEPVEAPDGVIEMVLDERGGRRRHLAEISSGHVTMWTADKQRPRPEPTSRIAGDWRGWADALGPDGDTSRLKLSGRTSQARRLLAAIVRPASTPGWTGATAPEDRAECA